MTDQTGNLIGDKEVGISFHFGSSFIENVTIGFMQIHTAEQLEAFPDEAANLFAEIDRLKAAEYYFGMEARHDEQLAK